MAGRGKDDEANPANQLGLDTRDGCVAEEVTQVGGAGANIGNDFFLKRDPHRHADVSVLLGEARQRLPHHGVGKRALANNRERLSTALLMTSRFRFELRGARQHGASVNKKLAAAFVECRAATRLAHKQRTREFVLEVVDVIADGGLRNAKLPRRRRETARFRNSYKDLESSQRWI